MQATCFCKQWRAGWDLTRLLLPIIVCVHVYAFSEWYSCCSLVAITLSSVIVCTCDSPACSIQWVHSTPPLHTIIYSKSLLLVTGAPIRGRCWENTLAILRWVILQHSVSTQSHSHATISPFPCHCSMPPYPHSRVTVTSFPCHYIPIPCHIASFPCHCICIPMSLYLHSHAIISPFHVIASFPCHYISIPMS